MEIKIKDSIQTDCFLAIPCVHKDLLGQYVIFAEGVEPVARVSQAILDVVLSMSPEGRKNMLRAWTLLARSENSLQWSLSSKKGCIVSTQDHDDDPKTCPQCGVSFQGQEIPKDFQEKYYGGQTHYSRVIGLYDMEKDKVTMWQCPDCKHQWPR